MDGEGCGHKRTQVLHVAKAEGPMRQFWRRRPIG